MRNRSFGGRSLQIASSLALCSFAVASQADPYTLEGFCTVTSTVTGQGKCELTWMLKDSYLTPTPARVVLIKVNGVQVQWYMNDDKNPSELTSVYGQTHVSCGVNHTVSALISKVGIPTYETVGSLPSVKCPVAP